MAPSSAAPHPRRLRSSRGEVVVIVLYVLGAVAVGLTGYKFLKWDPFKDASVASAAKKFEQAEARYAAATQAVQAAQQAAQQQTAAITADAKRQTQSAQFMVSATGQALATAPPEIRADLHVSAAIQTNTVAGQALHDVLGPLSPEQLTAVNRLVADATAASEARRAQAAAELTTVKQQLADEQTDKQRHQQLLRESDAKLAAAQKAAAEANAVVTKTARQLQAATSDHDGVSSLLDQLFFWLKIGGLLYLTLAYVLPVAARLFPGLHALAEIGHALLTPFTHQEKTGVEALARDASAATDELLELISQRSPDSLKEAHTRAGAWITDHDGVRARYEQMLRLTNRR